MAEYALQFPTLAASSGWDKAVYRQGLDTSVRTQMAIFGDPLGLEVLI